MALNHIIWFDEKTLNMKFEPDGNPFRKSTFTVSNVLRVQSNELLQKTKLFPFMKILFSKIKKSSYTRCGQVV